LKGGTDEKAIYGGADYWYFAGGGERGEVHD